MYDTTHPGISILIPIYNYPVGPLIKDLEHQLEQIENPYEIICIDDASSETVRILNRSMKSYSLQYSELSYNAGRSAIRNILARAARYPLIIFLDNDSRIFHSSFIRNYIKHSLSQVVVGGRVYAASPPELPFLLHWTVGRAREVKPASERQKSPYYSFMFNNLMMHKHVYLSIGLDESIKNYGHEDTKFGEKLKEGNINIIHIDNAVVHEGLDDTESFLKKTIEGVENLFKISKEGYGTSSSLFKLFNFINNYHAVKMVLWMLQPFYALMLKNLRSQHPSLKIYDLYKLYHLLKIARR